MIIADKNNAISGRAPEVILTELALAIKSAREQLRSRLPYLDADDDARVYGDAQVCGDARVYGNAQVCGDADYTTVKGFGTEFRTTTFFRCKDKTVRARCGCFYGDLNEFRNQVKNTRSGKIAEEYLIIADLMERHFKEE